MESIDTSSTAANTLEMDETQREEPVSPGTPNLNRKRAFFIDEDVQQVQSSFQASENQRVSARNIEAIYVREHG